ncbi:MAG: hypothetical protein KDK27_07945 [Leptospiraceae bacterium]|nr:hypothetical protein [Leptospiraceae bacterium]
MNSLHASDLHIDVSMPEENCVELRWSGKSDQPHPEVFLNPFLDTVLQYAGHAEIRIRFGDLSFLNSATLPCIVYFLNKALDRDAIVRLIYNERVNWQRAVFSGLASVYSKRNFILDGTGAAE